MEGGYSVRGHQNNSQIQSNELIYNLKTDSILSTERVKLKLMVEE